MNAAGSCRARGFTLVELLTAVAMLALLGLMSYRGLTAVLDVQERVARETEKWRAVTAFLVRLERDVQLAAARPVRAGRGELPPFVANENGALEFSRAPAGDLDKPRRIAYSYDGSTVALALWPGLDMTAETRPERHDLLSGVSRLELHYLDADLAWRSAWPADPSSAPLPLAVRVRIVLASGEDVVRVFALKT